ncbi:hypothetical protein [Spiroplasma sabaudiense]|uniref:hypothetical protein n=1 Tax=Spiroplasma sabaudiense TaxID=216944 RepID=UPI0004B96768|nr:hypothetical protein [Spiroplasma sabaudiense]
MLCKLICNKIIIPIKIKFTKNNEICKLAKNFIPKNGSLIINHEHKVVIIKDIDKINNIKDWFIKNLIKNIFLGGTAMEYSVLRIPILLFSLKNFAQYQKWKEIKKSINTDEFDINVICIHL